MMWRQFLIDRFGENAINPWCCLRDGGEAIIAQVLEGKGIHCAVEIGTFHGISAQYISRFVDKVITIDVEERPETKLIREFCRNPKVEYFVVKNDEEKKELISRLDFQFAFIDGLHNHMVDFDAEITKHCGNLLFHDYKNGFKFPEEAVLKLPPGIVTEYFQFGHWIAGGEKLVFKKHE